MEKIYSRPRLLLSKKEENKYNKISPNKKNNSFNNKEIIRKTAKIAIIIIIAISVATNMIRAVEPIINRQCINMAKRLATEISNEQLTVVMEKYDYDDFINIIQDQNGNIKMIKSNVISINEVTSDIAVKIQEEINKIEDDDFSIRLGSFTGIKLFSGRGPKVYVRMSTVGSVETNLISEFKSVGINQTLHRIYMEVKCNITVLTPYSSSEQTVTNQVLFAESVIVGTTPETFYQLDGMSIEDSLNMI